MMSKAIPKCQPSKTTRTALHPRIRHPHATPRNPRNLSGETTQPPIELASPRGRSILLKTLKRTLGRARVTMCPPRRTPQGRRHTRTPLPTCPPRGVLVNVDALSPPTLPSRGQKQWWGRMPWLSEQVKSDNCGPRLHLQPMG